MPKPTTNAPTRDSAAADPSQIAEGKLLRVEMIAREALDILGEDAPEDLRRSAADERARHEDEIRTLEDKLDCAARQIKSLSLDIKAAQRLAEDRLAEAEEVWGLASIQAADIKLANEQIEDMSSEIGLLRVTADSRAREIETLLRDAETTAEELEAALSERDTLREELSETVEDRDAIRAQLHSAYGTIQNLQEILENLRQEHETAATEMQGQLAEALETNDDLSERLAQHADRISTLEADLDLARQQIADRSSSLHDAEERLQAARETLAELETELDQSTNALESSKLSEQAAIEQASRARAELGKIRSELADLTARLAERDRLIAELSNQEHGAAPTEPVLRPIEPVRAIEQASDDAVAEPAFQVVATDTMTAEPTEAELTELARLREDLEARQTEMAFLREQLDRADARAARYKDKAQEALTAYEKSKAIVRRARRRSARRTELYAGTVDAMSRLRIRCTELSSERDELAELARIRLIWALAAGGLALIGILSAAAF